MKSTLQFQLTTAQVQSELEAAMAAQRGEIQAEKRRVEALQNVNDPNVCEVRSRVPHMEENYERLKKMKEYIAQGETFSLSLGEFNAVICTRKMQHLESMDVTNVVSSR